MHPFYEAEKNAPKEPLPRQNTDQFISPVAFNDLFVQSARGSGEAITWMTSTEADG